MNDRPVVLLTNDDGIDSPGLHALYDAIEPIAAVTAVAPAEDQSAVGRSISRDVDISEHELGFAVSGTPADCVVAALECLVPDVDFVVSGCNQGANLGAYVLGRSGTVGAAIEAAFFDVPAIAVSQYVAAGKDITWMNYEVPKADYADAADATRYLLEHAPDAGVFEQCDFLNVNVPDPGQDVSGMEITRPSRVYDMNATLEGERVSLSDNIWSRMTSGEIPDSPGTDRRAVVDGHISVSPMVAPQPTEHHEALDGLAAAYEPTRE